MKDLGTGQHPNADRLPAVSDAEQGAALRAEHTPGPWKVYADETDPGTPFVKDAVVVADIDCGGDLATIIVASANYHAPTLARANARLIAAAPDMLAALKRTLADDASDLRMDTREAIRAAIAKAEGR